MPYLTQSIEWRLLQELGRLLRPRMAPHEIQWESLGHHNGTSLRAQQLEVELRQALIVEELSINMDEKDYDLCRTNLTTLCSLLNELSNRQNVHTDRVVTPYPRLDSLVKYLRSESGMAKYGSLDLVNGPNEKLFNLPQDDEQLKGCLSVVSQCNSTLSRLLRPAIPETRTLREKKTGTWKKARIRDHAKFTLDALFNYFKCGTSHEVLLKLSEDPDEDAVLPSLQIMLSLCQEPESLQEAWCDSVNLDATSISSIVDLCDDLRQQAGPGKALMLLIKEYAIFGTWEYSASLGTDWSTKQSLHQLIVNGVFKPPDLSTLLNGPSLARFSIKDKRELAVKLGFCLMDFFDADLTSNRIYFSGSLGNTRKEFPHLAFNSKLPAFPDSYDFGMGHPALLSFAKILVELDVGESMDLFISPDHSKNSHAYAQLMVLVDRLERERSDSYVQAIRGCLIVHYKIARILRSRGLRDKAADRKIRKKIYSEIVKKLEDGLAESTPRSAHKRQRSVSPYRPDHYEGVGVAGPRKMAFRSPESKRPAPEFKRQRTYGSQNAPEMHHSSDEAFAGEEPLTMGSQSGPAQPHTQPPVYEELGPYHSTNPAGPSDSWFAELSNMNSVIRVKPGERDSLAPRVRIAILDTGIEDQYSASIEDYHDFVDETNPSRLDSTGHGTKVFRLLQKVCEDAQYFVGRVWEGSQDSPRTPTLMESAIDHAREVWKVDVIVISSGFRTAHNNIGEAIERANMARILVFASPSNYGNLSDVYYPGRLYGHGKVICLFSTNSMVRSSTTKTFNPSPLDTAAHRTFAILGEDIFLENTKGPLNGTSYSTAIGAGIAARILDFSRHPEFRERINIDDLRKVEGMLSVFGRMAKRTDNGYRCIAPWEICPPPEQGIDRREARKCQQSAVFDELKEALKNIHRA